MCIVIVGSGIIGSSLALAISIFSNNKIPIFIIEQQNFTKNIRYNNNVVLSYETYKTLKKIRVWNEIKQFVTPIKDIKINEKENFGFLSFNFKDFFISSLGYVVKLNKINKKIIGLVKQQNNIVIYDNSYIKNIIYIKNNINIILNNNFLIKAKLLVLATGSNYLEQKNLFNIKWKEKKYNQIAILFDVYSELSHNNCAYEYFTNTGSVAVLPILNNKLFIIYCVSINKKSEFYQWQDKDFLKYFQFLLGSKVGKLSNISRKYTVPLSLKIADKIINNRIVLVGNVAQTLHPIAGQGLNLGLRDSMTLAKLTIESFAQCQDPGNINMLKKYRKYRFYDRQITIKLTDFIVKIFNNKCLPIIIGRNIGLNFINNFFCLKKIIFNKLTGFY